MDATTNHIPVLLQEALFYLNLKPGDKVIDATTGLGGHSKEILEVIGRNGKLLAIDKDPNAIMEVKKRLKGYGGQIYFKQGGFDHIQEYAESNQMGEVNGILVDLGISSVQLEDPIRGFSFMKDGPLDMRMDFTSGRMASDLINEASYEELVQIFTEYGEERYSKRIAKQICFNRKQNRIETTGELRKIIEKVVPRKKTDTIHPATKVFQALRILINDELGALARMLDVTSNILAPGGRLVVISFHSLEDRIVKQFFNTHAKDCICPPESPICNCEAHATWKIITRKPIKPTEEEIKKQIAKWIVDALKNKDDEDKLGKLKEEVKEMCLKFPVPGIKV